MTSVRHRTNEAIRDDREEGERERGSKFVSQIRGTDCQRRSSLRGERGEQTDRPSRPTRRVVRKRALVLALSRERDRGGGGYVCISRGDAGNKQSPPSQTCTARGWPRH